MSNSYGIQRGRSILPPDAYSGSSAAASKRLNPLTPHFEHLVQKLLKQWHAPGVSIGVVDGDDSYTAGYGLAALPNTPATSETLYPTASTTKAFTAALLSCLMHSGEYPQLAKGWDTPISSLMRDDFILHDEWATAHVTLDDAACHRTGLPEGDFGWRDTDDGQIPSDQHRIQQLRHVMPSLEPRQQLQYNNSMYVVLARATEVIAGKRFPEILRDKIWGPLKMDNTFLDTYEALNTRLPLARGYNWNEENKEQREYPVESVRSSSGAGGTISNVIDYTKWIHCLLHRGPEIPAQVHDDLRKMRTMDTDETLYGLGWVKTLRYGETMYIHTGGKPCFSSYVMWFPEHKYGLVAMTNTALSSHAAQIALAKLIEDRFEVPHKKRIDADKELEKLWRPEGKSPQDGMKMWYPDVQLPSPSDVGLLDIVGTYRAPGHGRFVLVANERVDKGGNRTLLTADTSSKDRFRNEKWHMRHVSGRFWLIEVFDSIVDVCYGFHGAEVMVGPAGQVTGLKITLTPPGSKPDHGFVLFSKI